MLSALAGAVLVVAAITDVRSRQIPNWLPVTLAVAGVADLVVVGDLWAGLAVGLGLFACGLLAFAVGLAGGGDVKLLAAAGLWVPLGAVGEFLTLVAFTGAVLALTVLARRRIVAVIGGAPPSEPPTVPYAVAIAVGAGTVLIAAA